MTRPVSEALAELAITRISMVVAVLQDHPPEGMRICDIRAALPAGYDEQPNDISSHLFGLIHTGRAWMIRRRNKSRYFRSAEAQAIGQALIDAEDARDAEAAAAAGPKVDRRRRENKAQRLTAPKPQPVDRTLGQGVIRAQAVIDIDALPAGVRITRAKTPPGRFDVEGPVSGEFMAQWRALRSGA